MNESLAFIVPYRSRPNHLGQFIPHYTRRFKDAKFFIIEQGDNKPFNRGKLLNIGFLEYGKDFDYVALHDIDMLLSKGDYSYPEKPTHLATKVQQFKYSMPSPDYFGGVVLFNRFDFAKVNGYSNNFFGWGGEDNQLYFECLKVGLEIERRDCFYQSLYHPPTNPKGFDQAKMDQAKQPRKENDGLTNCDYKIIDRIEFPLYTKLIVEL